MKEVFKPILELDSHYSISNLGNVYRHDIEVNSAISKTGKRKLLGAIKPAQDNGKGYKQLYVQIKRQRRLFYIHRLVAKYFIDNPHGKKEVNHIDADKSNNCVTNLEWVTIQENRDHAKANKLLPYGQKSTNSKLTEYQVMAIRTLKAINPKFNRTNVAFILGVRDTAICRVANGKRWQQFETPRY